LKKQIEELTLMLLYLSGWDEDVPPFGKHKRSWKNHNSGALINLDREGLIVGSDKANTVFLTDEGASKAKELVRRYFGDSVEILSR